MRYSVWWGILGRYSVWQGILALYSGEVFWQDILARYSSEVFWRDGSNFFERNFAHQSCFLVDLHKECLDTVETL